jgi:cytochrome c biogenesis protein CcmG/thiol:disulfide interchange protein DsbE
MQSRRSALAAALLGLVLGMAATAACAAASNTPAPAGSDPPIDLAAWKGKVVYLDFWASWCVPCKQSFPWMNQMHSRYGKDGLVIVAVNMDQNRADADSFLRKYPADFTVRFDPQGRSAAGFKLRGMPTSALLDRNGKVLLVHEGFRGKDAANLEASIRAALK